MPPAFPVGLPACFSADTDTSQPDQEADQPDQQEHCCNKGHGAQNHTIRICKLMLLRQRDGIELHLIALDLRLRDQRYQEQQEAPDQIQHIPHRTDRCLPERNDPSARRRCGKADQKPEQEKDQYKGSQNKQPAPQSR